MVANKTDIMADDSLLTELREHVEALGYPIFTISAAAHMGVKELIWAIA